MCFVQCVQKQIYYNAITHIQVLFSYDTPKCLTLSAIKCETKFYTQKLFADKDFLLKTM